MSMDLASPEATIGRFSDLLSRGDLPAMLAMYEPEAVFVPEPGRTVCGREEIGRALGAFLALRPAMTGRPVKTVTAGDTSIVHYRWELRGLTPAGEPVELAGTSTDVLRRRDDGTWGILVDDPWGSAVPS
ncbi:MAG: nuclear transport factor 2 family protein [Myxococcota bacterium]